MTRIAQKKAKPFSNTKWYIRNKSSFALLRSTLSVGCRSLRRQTPIIKLSIGAIVKEGMMSLNWELRVPKSESAWKLEPTHFLLPDVNIFMIWSNLQAVMHLLKFRMLFTTWHHYWRRMEACSVSVQDFNFGFWLLLIRTRLFIQNSYSLTGAVALGLRKFL